MAAPIFCGSGGTEINTALGCVPVGTPAAFVGWFLPKLLGIVGGVAFLLMVYGSFLIITSGGDTNKVKAGQQTITAAISGLVFAIFSLFILRLIGVDILKIPGLR